MYLFIMYWQFVNIAPFIASESSDLEQNVILGTSCMISANVMCSILLESKYQSDGYLLYQHEY